MRDLPYLVRARNADAGHARDTPRSNRDYTPGVLWVVAGMARSIKSLALPFCAERKE